MMFNKWNKGLLSGVVLALTFIVLSGKAHADIFADPSTLTLPSASNQDIHLSINSPSGTGTGAGANLPLSIFKIYTNPADTSNQNLTIHLDPTRSPACPAAYEIRIILVRVDSSDEASNPAAIYSKTIPNSSDKCSDFNISLPTAGLNMGNASFGHGGVRVGELWLSIQPTNSNDNNYYTSSFRLTGTQSMRLGYMAGAPFAIIPNDAAPDSRTTSFPFRGKCGSSSTSAQLQWADPDFSQPPSQQINGPYWDLQENGTPKTLGDLHDPSGTNVYASKSFTANPGVNYTWSIGSIYYGNGIGYKLPFDSADFDFTCPVITPVHVAVDPVECGSKWITGIAWKDNGSNLPFNGMIVDIYYNPPGGQPPDVTMTANQPGRPADSGNAGNSFFNNYVFSSLVPDAYRDGFTHTFYIYAHDPSNPALPGAGPAYYSEYGCAVRAVNVSSNVNLKPDPENPTAYNTVNNFALIDDSDANFQPVINMSQCQVNVTKTTGALTVPWPPSYSCVGAHPVNNSNQTYTSPDGNPAPFAAGTNFCSTISLYQAGFIYRGDNKFIGTNYGPIGGNCDHVINEPYVHVLGSDAQAGGGFGSNCTVTPGGIDTYLKNTGTTPTGSGVQIGALSIGPISGFSSAILRGAAPTGSKGLSFSNTDNITGGTGDAPNEGGKLGNNHCVTDYFSKLPDGTATSTANASTTNLANGTPAAKNITQYYEPSSGTLTLSGGTIDDHSNLAIFVKGDVRITGAIKFANASWGTIERIPSFYLIVKGNIYIDKSVGQLDGMYIAQPNAAAGSGTINTCANGSSAYSPASLLSNCKSQLLVNGSFVAQHVYLDRSFGSVRNAYPGEHLTGTPYNCTDSGNTPYGDCAGEIFNFSPELYLIQPAFEPSGGPTSGKYDYVTSLAPVL
jgi:hypothetical protein